MWNDLLAARDALWRREAELAANVPVIPHAAEEEHLASKLQATLRAGAEAVHCHAAALYLLDDATSELKLRSSWNLPFGSLLRPARPLRGAVADLEALLGHAVVLEDATMFESWKAPDEITAGAAVCVPVSTPTMPLGTLWLFANEARPFSDRETNMIEVVAGRLAAELERVMLLTEGASAVQERRDWEAVGRFQQDQLPSQPPPVEGLDVAGWSRQSGTIGGAFHDWFMLPDGKLALAVGRARQAGVDAALTASALRSALRAHAEYHADPAELVARVNETLYHASAGDQFAQLAYLVVDPRSGEVQLVSAGNMGGAVLRGGLWVPLTASEVELGVDPDLRFPARQLVLATGETLIMASGPIRKQSTVLVWPWDNADLSTLFTTRGAAPARQWADLMHDSGWADTQARDAAEDLAVLVVRRTDRHNT
jgi:GAF domain-containing protein